VVLAIIVLTPFREELEGCGVESSYTFDCFSRQMCMNVRYEKELSSEVVI
jgi:hypothetical protein